MMDQSHSRRLWEEISLSQWKDILTQAGAGSSWGIKGRALKGCCPFPGHIDSRPSCWIVPEKGFVKCFGCEKYESNPVKFIATISKLSWVGVARLLRSKGVKSFPKKLERELHSREIRHNVKQEFAYACNRILVEASEDPTSQKYVFAQKCITYLESRGIDRKNFCNLPIGVLPSSILLNEKITMATEVYEYTKDIMTTRYIGALVFFYHKSPTELSRFKLRADFMRQDTSLKDELFIRDDYESSIGFFGLSNFIGSLGKGGKTQVSAMLVEGEFDALAHLTNYLDNITYDIVLCIGGSGATSSDLLRRNCSIDSILVVADHPKHGGDTITKAVLKNTTMSCKVFDWPEEVNAKDPHEAIVTYGWQPWIECLNATTIDNRSISYRTFFTAAYKWLIALTLKQLSTIQAEDIQEIKRVIADNGSCLRDSDAQRLYCKELHKQVNLPLGTLLELVVGQDDSEEGFIARIIQALKDEFYFVGIDGSDGMECIIKAWHRNKREPREWRISRTNELFGKIAIDLGPPVNWLKRSVGIPRLLATKQVGKATKALSIVELNTNLKRYMELSIESVASELPTLTSLEELKAGSHFLQVDLGNGTEDVWAIVNGSDVFLGRYSESNINWTLLDGPRLGQYVFNIIRSKWSSEIQSSHDLNLGNEVDISETYDFLVSAINLGWLMDGGLEDCEYLAAAMMLNPIAGCLPRQLYTLLNGQRGSGKSKLLALIAGKDPKFRLLESVTDVQTSYTVAGIRKDANRCGMGVALDEFEDKGDDRHSRAVREFLIDVRQLTNSRQSIITRGNTDNKEATVYVLKCQIWACSINYLRDEADISRFMQLQTIRVEDKPEPHTVLDEVFGEHTLGHFRRNISLGMYKKAPEILNNLAELRLFYNDSREKDSLAAYVGIPVVPSRFLDGVIITAALVKAIGRDPHNYIRRVVKKKANLISRIVSSTHAQDLLDQVLSCRVEYQRPGSSARTTAIRTILADNTERFKLVELDCGLAYVEYLNSGVASGKTKVLIVMWPDVLPNLLNKISRFSKETSGRLKRMGDSADNAMKYNTIRKKVPTISTLLKPGIRSSDITIYDITTIIDSWDERLV